MNPALKVNLRRKTAFIVGRHFQTIQSVKIGWNVTCVVIENMTLGRE